MFERNENEIKVMNGFLQWLDHHGLYNLSVSNDETMFAKCEYCNLMDDCVTLVDRSCNEVTISFEYAVAYINADGSSFS